MFVLLTGGLGFIGSNVVVELIKNNQNVIIFDNLYNSTINVITNICKIANSKNFIYINGDIKNDNDLDRLFRYNISFVIHFAAYKAVSESIKKPLKYYDNNIIGLLKIIKKCNEKNINNFIFSSSATVYGNSKVPLKEISQIGIGITNPYGQTKYMAEQILSDVCKSNNNFNAICLRYFNPVGAHPSGLLGEDPNGIPNNLMPILLKIVKQNKENNNLESVLSIFGNDYNTKDGTCERDFIHITDLAQAHIQAFKKINTLKNNYNVYNIGTGKPTSVLKLVNTFEKVNNIKIPYVFKNRREGDLASLYCNCEKAKKELEWEAKLTIEDICRDSYNFINH